MRSAGRHRSGRHSVEIVIEQIADSRKTQVSFGVFRQCMKVEGIMALPNKNCNPQFIVHDDIVPGGIALRHALQFLVDANHDVAVKRIE